VADRTEHHRGPGPVRKRPDAPGAAGVAAIVWGAVELLFIVRFDDNLDWSRPNTVVYSVFVLSVIAIGAAAWSGSRRAAASA
jgi:hypothetical protein